MQNAATIKQGLEQFRSKCSDAGIKITRQRLAIFKVVISSQKHPSADEIYQQLHKELPEMSLDTVYRTLWLLHDLGLLEVVNPQRGNLRFDANLRRHHHFICTSCGAIQDFYSSEMDSLSIPAETEALGIAASMHVEIRGICQSCLSTISKNNIKKGEDK